jgi:imidazolonepropionase-like amidohydrolase
MGGIPWTEPIAQEFSRMVALGMPPMEAVQCSTSHAALLLDMEGKIGVIAPGAFADIVALRGDPLGDIKALENLEFVMKDGKVFAGGNSQNQAGAH